MDRTKKIKEKDSGYDTIPGHLPQAWRKPRVVSIPNTQFSFGGEEEGGGDEVVGLPSFLSLCLRTEFSSFSSRISHSSSNTFLDKSCLFSCKRRKGINWILGLFALLGRLYFLKSTCMPPSWGNGTSSSSELVSSFFSGSWSSSSSEVQP